MDQLARRDAPFKGGGDPGRRDVAELSLDSMTGHAFPGAGPVPEGGDDLVDGGGHGAGVGGWELGVGKCGRKLVLLQAPKTLRGHFHF